VSAVRPFPRSASSRAVATTALELVVAVALATAAVAALDTIAPTAGLGVIYLLAVLFVAIRRGELAALAAALLSVLTLNYFFIEPRHRLTIASSENAVALVVFLIAAVVVGRLAAAARQRAHEAEDRARLAAAREREAGMLARAASDVMAGDSLAADLRAVGEHVAEATGAAGARLRLEAAPATKDGEVAVRLPMATRPGWLYATPAPGWQEADLRRIAEPLARLIDVAVERKRAEARMADAEAARRADVAKTAVLHAISHDLRSPLTAITTAAGGLGDAALGPDDRADLVSVIGVESSRLARLVDDLLDLSRIEAGAVDPQPDWCDLHDVLGSATAAIADHPIDLALDRDLPLVRADPAQLERVFANLLENAVRFSPDGAPVRVTAAVGGGAVTVTVTDRGRGVAAAHRNHVFEPFYRAGESRGSGLGLAICRGFVEANGGRIRLLAAQEGAAFAVSIPLVEQPAPAP
jgi:two-component system, OmpR family, sensor histidine kinase KdpD